MFIPGLIGNGRLSMAAQALKGSSAAPLLIEGPSGSGKRTAARGIAMALLCKSDAPACTLCGSCIRFVAGSHPDFYVLQYEGKPVKVEQVRDLRARTFVKPSEADFKVFVIEESDRLSTQCQNALLKVLEEPGSSVFILLCENRDALLPTVRSRCTAYRMQPLNESELLSRLSGHSGDISAAISASGGFLGAAEEYLSASSPEYAAIARRFVDALRGPELALFAACISAGSLGRDGYASFCDSTLDLLLSGVKQSGTGYLIDIYEYIQKQKTYFISNPSPVALSSDLAAYCAQITGLAHA